MTEIEVGPLFDTVFLHEAFHPIPTADRKTILARCKRRHFRAGSYLYRRGDEADGIYIILTGGVRITGVSSDGREFILDLCGPGFWIGEIAVLEEGRRTLDACAETDIDVLQLRVTDFEHLLTQLPSLSRAMLRLEAKRFRQVSDWAERTATISMPALLALRLTTLARRDPDFGKPGHMMELVLTQETLSHLAGSSRQRVNQILGDWQQRGLVAISSGRIQLLDIALLDSISLLTK